MKCIVKGCENHKNEGGFEDGMCLPCYLFITTGEGVYSQAYRNAKPAELTDEEMMKAEYEFMYWNRSLDKPPVEIAYELGVFQQAVAILRKAQEK